MADLKQWLPITKKEVELRGWDYIDIILFSGDAYIDHPSFGAAVIGRTLEANGYRVAIIPQPNWQDDLRDFKKLGKPRICFCISAGSMDSMVNHYTANRRKRSDDAYTPDGRHGMRPDYPTIVYGNIIKQLYPDVPLIIGGIEASLRRLSHYDYWQDKLLPSILPESKADLLIYGMGEKAIVEVANRIKKCVDSDNYNYKSALYDIPQTSVLCDNKDNSEKSIELNSYEDCLKDKKKQAENFKHIEQESNRWESHTLYQKTNKQYIKVNPPYPTMTTEEIDASFDLPYTRLPHPKYKGKHIPAYEMIKHSVNLHRGCFGGCAFCTISAHQGKHVSSRSKRSILREVKIIAAMPDFKGYLSDLGGPSANMYSMKGKNEDICKKCVRPSCLTPEVCKNLNTDHGALLDIYRSVNAIEGIKKSNIGSGVRYDLSMYESDDENINARNRKYNEELIHNHVSGRLKVAPEHTSDKVLKLMRKPSFKKFEQFKQIFDYVNHKYNLNQQLIPYFISSHPGCTEEDMAELAVETKKLNFHLEQVQDFTPTPMTLATEIYYTGYHPYTGERVYTAHSKDEKLAQRNFFFWYLPEERGAIKNSLKRMHREDLERQLFMSKDKSKFTTNKSRKINRK